MEKMSESVEDYKQRLLDLMHAELKMKYGDFPENSTVCEHAKRKLRWEGYFQALETVKNFK